jgi:hypothetical protein
MRAVQNMLPRRWKRRRMGSSITEWAESAYIVGKWERGCGEVAGEVVVAVEELVGAKVPAAEGEQGRQVEVARREGRRCLIDPSTSGNGSDSSSTKETAPAAAAHMRRSAHTVGRWQSIRWC